METIEHAQQKGGPEENSAPAGSGDPAYTPCTRARSGKIARLPAAIRREVNRRLDEGMAGPAICDWLNGLPEVKAVLEREFDGEPVSEMNLSRWRSGGFAESVSRDRAVEILDRLSERACEMSAGDGVSLSHRIASILTAQLAIQVAEWEAVPPGERKAALWREIMRSLVALRRGDLHLERLAAERERFELRKFRSRQELEEAFFRWMRSGDNLARVRAELARLDGEAAQDSATAKAKRRRVREALGLG
jgi:hypothetical protein